MPPMRKQNADYSMAMLVAMIVGWFIIGLGFVAIILNLKHGHH